MKTNWRSPDGPIDLNSMLEDPRPAGDEALFDAVERYHTAYRWLRRWTDEAAHQLVTRGSLNPATREILRQSIVSVKIWRRTVSEFSAQTVRGTMARALVTGDRTAGRY